MKRLILHAALLTLTIIPAMGAGAADVGPVPADWSLGRNDPNPMCGETSVVFGVPQVAHVQFAIWNADQTAVVRLLLDQMLPAGFHAIMWDGLDDLGAQVPNGPYLYRYVAQVDGETVFDASVTFQVECSVTVEGRTWGALKSLYRP